MDTKSGGRILIVDDDATSRKVLVRTLSAAGYECYESESGSDALKLVRREQPALLILDYDMPGLDGAEVLKRLRKDHDLAVAQIPAIMLTGHGGEESEVLCLEAGADDFVTKPFDADELRARLRVAERILSLQADANS